MSLKRQVAPHNREALLRAFGIDPSDFDAYLALRKTGSPVVTPTRTILLDDAIRDFLAALQTLPSTQGDRKRRSQDTYSTYAGVLNGFREFLHERWSGLPPEARTVQRITGADIEEYVLRPRRNGRPRSAFTVNRDTAIISSMMKWLMKRGLLASNPVQTVSRLREPRLLPVALSETEQEMLLDLSRQTACGLRNHTIIHLVLNTGLRVQEVSSLRWSDIDLEGGWLRVWGKGDKERAIPLRPIVVQSLRYYWTACRSKQTAAPGFEDAVFISERGPRALESKVVV